MGTSRHTAASRLADKMIADAGGRRPGTTALYRLFAADGTLLYVGVSHNPRTRIVAHSNEKAWWAEVATGTIEWFEDRAEALEEEQWTIWHEGPLHNVDGPPRDLPYFISADPATWHP